MNNQSGDYGADGPSFTARIKGEGYDLQVCTDEPLTDEERAALHEFCAAHLARREGDG